MLGSEFTELAILGDATSEHVRTLLRARTHEDQWIDFKSGLWLQNKDDRPNKVGDPIEPTAKLRRFVSSFANAEGGCVVVGVVDKDDRAHEIDGCANVGRESPKVWAERALAPLAFYMTAPVRCSSVDVDGMTVLVVAVARSERLVPCTELGQLVHYMRIGEQSPRVPEYLVKDVVLGRRQRPEISVDIEFLTPEGSKPDSVDFRVHVRNEGLSPIASLVVAVARYREQGEDSGIRPGLRRFVEVVPCDGLAVVRPGFAKQPRYAIAPFDAAKPVPFGVERIAPPGRGSEVTTKAVVLVAPENDMPHAIQVSARFVDGWLMERTATVLPTGVKGIVALEWPPAST